MVELNRARLDAILRLLLDSGDMTPMAVRQINEVVDDEQTKSALRVAALEFSEAWNTMIESDGEIDMVTDAIGKLREVLHGE